MATTEALTEREQQALEQMRKAQELGLTLKDHAAKTGVDVRRLYELRRRLVRKGAFGCRRRTRVRRSRGRWKAGCVCCRTRIGPGRCLRVSIWWALRRGEYVISGSWW